VSYDLNLICRCNETPNPDEVALWLSTNGMWARCWNVDDAAYFNADTGVYFPLDLFPKAESDAESPWPEGWNCWAQVRVNYWRPSPFIKEACLAINALLDAFGGSIEDPQTGVTGGFDPAATIGCWTRTCRSISSEWRERAGEAFASEHALAPSSLLDAIWRWNLGRPREYELLEENGLPVFVPRIFFLNDAGRAAPIMVWPNALAIAIPEFVEWVLLGYSEVSRREGFFGPPVNEAMASMADLRPALSPYLNGGASDGTPIYGLCRGSLKKQWMKTFVRSGSPVDKRQLVTVAFEQILDADFFEPAGA
jgi:hypothetical protein